MVGGTIHEKFAEKICEKFDKPKKYTVWALAPDHGFWLNTYRANRLGHRFTLHGFDNVNKAIELLKEKALFHYSAEDEDIIKTAVASHTFLDLFNFWVVPSYPNSSDFRGIKEQRKYYIKSGFSHFFPKSYQQPNPSKDEWVEVFDEILDEFDSIEELDKDMRYEFYKLPYKGFMIEKILKLYKD